MGSPRTRGWSRWTWTLSGSAAAFPAYAGVVHEHDRVGQQRYGVPRVRGGGPVIPADNQREQLHSPRTRGWSVLDTGQDAQGGAFPAYAGVVPVPRPAARSAHGVPRVRGGGPCSIRGRLRRMVRSPRTRGWSRLQHVDVPGRGAFPAYAGVVPVPRPAARPAHGVPRVRGGGPCSIRGRLRRMVRSPRTRGWSRLQHVDVPGRGAFPAYAGVVPRAGSDPFGWGGVPRVRGGGPPKRCCAPSSMPSVPRVRGGGPLRWASSAMLRLRSPRTRGWSPYGGRPRVQPKGFPRTRGWSPSSPGCADVRVAFPAYAG